MMFKRSTFLFFAVASLACVSQSYALEYPVAQKQEQHDDYFGTIVVDPFRWLEDATSKETQQWIVAQNLLTTKYLSHIPCRSSIENRLKELVNYQRTSAPYAAGEYFLTFQNSGLQNQSVLYIQKGLAGISEVLLDPNSLSQDGTISINLKSISKDHKYAAIGFMSAGSDVESIRIMDLESKTFIQDELNDVKFSPAEWRGNGFYYTCAGSDEILKVYYHVLGTDQQDDTLIYADYEHPDYFCSPQVTDDEKFLVLSIHPGGSSFNFLYLKDLTDVDAPLIKIEDEKRSSYQVIGSDEDYLIICTSNEAPKKQIIRLDIKNVSRKDWKTLIPETDDQLESAQIIGGKIILSYLHNVSSLLLQYDLNGNFEHEIVLPALGTVSELIGEKKENILFYSFDSLAVPYSIYKYNILTGVSELWAQNRVNFDPSRYLIEQVYYKSKDGTSIPMFLVRDKNLDMTVPHPTLLYGYGGFKISVTPRFNVSRVILLENGGIFAMPALRGGGEFGEQWHAMGMLLQKQNVFDDFIAAAEFLIDKGYTSKDKLAIQGRSNGGLLVGACMTQRPDLFKVCFPQVGVLDMLRYHKFTVGKYWTSEYGCSAEHDHFLNLISYSPLHNVKRDIAYPATLIMTGDCDDRVVPAHSYKFAATLQELASKQNPMLIKITTNVGHGAGKSMSKYLEEEADFWSFMFFYTK